MYVKNIVIFYAEFTKNLIFHSLTFHSKIHKYPTCKRNRDEQGVVGQKLEVLNEHTF